jgi:replicative DNA helicase
MRRLLCSRARVDARREGRTSTDALRRLTMAADELSRASIYVDDTAGMTMMTLRDRARQQKARTGLGLVVVDYLEMLSFPGSESRRREISSISRSLKSLAVELDVPIVALSQISRGVELRLSTCPELADLRRSGPIEQDADVVLLLHRPEYYSEVGGQEREVAEVIVAKHRNGPTATVRLRYVGSLMRFENLAPTGTELIA